LVPGAIPTRFVPLLREAGLSHAQIHVLLVENPRRVLAGDRETRSARSGAQRRTS
jgi:predicted metal-dependent phosphotriesterase family hydrolase